MGENDFTSTTDAFLTWLIQNGIQISTKCSLMDLREEGRGRGLVATGSFEEDEIIFTVPRRAVLNVQNAIHDPSLNKYSISAALLEDMPSWLSLTVVLMSETQCEHSHWSPYLAILPLKLDSLIFWSPSELLELQASAIVNKIGKADAEAIFQRSIETLGLANGNIGLFHQMASTIMAYAFDLPVEDPPNDLASDEGEEFIDDENQKTSLTMIPLADMLNADAERNNARLVSNSEDLEMRSIKKISKSEEIFNDYGLLPRSDLLRRYGYITDNYAQFDVAELSTKSIVTAFETGLVLDASASPFKLSMADLEARLELARREDVYEDSYDISHASAEKPCLPDELIALIYLFLIDNKTMESILNLDGGLPTRTKMATEFLGIVMAKVLTLREQEYSTSLEEDDALLKTGILSYRKEMAVKVRRGEKAVLREAKVEAASFQETNKQMGINLEQGIYGAAPNPPKRSRIR